ncbi:MULTISPECIES: SIR2 family NAD-dependent protein deacylase [Pseudomonas]|uniref:SIR2-like domain-containing protein n=1 Tax=Pseudomonas lutea TaxID=243924 RepID=A0A9X8MHS0_9PSED|nr:MULTISPECIES: SIR2 family protein [Pseudomonas]SER49117.1 SIR2-like domain-containing protein [Pseudomonas lutea]
MERNYKKYVEDVTEDIKKCIEDMACQPILFVGSGLTRRHLNGPGWEALLKYLADQCPDIDRNFAYYKQRHHEYVDIGTVFAEKYNDWAWTKGEPPFPEHLYEDGNPPDIYLKYTISKFFERLLEEEELMKLEEIELLQRIRPHSIITTNYDRLLEKIFPEYTSIIGQKILYANHSSVGEIFKIHGCASEPDSIVITREDYNEFIRRKKYLSAKLLTFFAEHPLIFIGYGAEDPNIKAILADIDEILSEDGKLIPNIYILERDESDLTEQYPRRERLIRVSEHRGVIIKSIVAGDFSWVYSAFGAHGALNNVDPRLLRALLARTYELVRSDIPRNPVQVDYKVLANVTEEKGALAKLYGISDSSDGLAFNLNYPYTLTAIGQALGYNFWHKCDRMLKLIKDETGVDLKSFDNKYHCAIMNGDEVQTHRYSECFKELLEKVRSGEDFRSEVIAEAKSKAN